MADIDRLVRVGLWGPSQRNDALRRLNWWAHVVKGMSGEQVEQFLVQWIVDRHNGMSKEYLARPDQVRRHIARIVQRFDPGKVGKCIRKSCNTARIVDGLQGRVRTPTWTDSALG